MLVIVMLFAFVLLLAGVNFGMRSDVVSLATQTVNAGASGLEQAVINRTDQVRGAVLQSATQASMIDAVRARNLLKIRSIASDAALAADLAFIVVTDARGTVIAGSRPASGSLAANSSIAASLHGDSPAGLQLLDAASLKSLLLSVAPPAAAITVATPIRDASGTIGVVYGGALVDGSTKFLDEAGRVTGGVVGVVVDGKFVDTSLKTDDAQKKVGLAVRIDPSVVASRNTVIGTQTVDGTEYFTKVTPVAGADEKTVGALWFGVPYSRFTTIVNDALRQIVIWGIFGLIVASIVGAVVASRIGRAISRRSEEVNQSAKQLRVLVVGGEVSGDHVSQTRETLEEIKQLAQEAAATAKLHALAGQALEDVVVIDTLTSELSSRMRDAAVSVERLSEVAEELDALVAGARPSRN